MAAPNKTVVEKEGVGGALQIDLHPLVIINISDHYTRAKVGGTTPGAPPRVIGALLGIQNGRNIEISNSFELVYHNLSGAVVVDMEYLKSKQEQCMYLTIIFYPLDFFKNIYIFVFIFYILLFHIILYKVMVKCTNKWIS